LASLSLRQVLPASWSAARQSALWSSLPVSSWRAQDAVTEVNTSKSASITTMDDTKARARKSVSITTTDDTKARTSTKESIMVTDERMGRAHRRCTSIAVLVGAILGVAASIGCHHPTEGGVRLE